MSAKKKKKRITSAPAIKSREAFYASVDELCEKQLKLESRVNLRDRLLNEIRKDHDEEIERLGESIQAQHMACAAFAKENRATLFVGGLKSAATSLGRFGFSFGKSALTTKTGTKWADVIATLKQLGNSSLIKVKESADKEAIKKLSEEDMAAIGCRLTKTESFFVEPKRDNPERIQPA